LVYAVGQLDPHEAGNEKLYTRPALMSASVTSRTRIWKSVPPEVSGLRMYACPMSPSIVAGVHAPSA
jgi:hypothetical protein